MADLLPAGLLEVCVVVGASSDRLKDICEEREKELPLLEAEVLQVHAPPFVKKENESEPQAGLTRVQRRRSFIKKKRERFEGVAPAEPTAKSADAEVQDVTVPINVDLVALPQLCFPEGLHLSRDFQEDHYHFLVFTDVLGNRTHGVVVQYCKPIQNGPWSSPKGASLYCPYSICVISKYPYYNALRDCLSSLMAQLKTCRRAEWDLVKDFAARLALVPIPPPGQLHVVFNLRPLQIILPSTEDKEQPIIDLDLHLPFLCFKPRQLLQVITSMLTEQRVVLLSSDWALLTLLAHCFLLFIRPLSWQHPFVPILSQQMLDFIMAPTAFLMGCHLRHFEEVAAETDDLILINIDEGTVVSFSSDSTGIPEVPLVAEDCFIKRGEALRMHYDLDISHLATSTDINDLRAQRRLWQQNLNAEVQKITLELMVNIFREVQDHLNYEHRVFNSEEFLKSRDPRDQPFYEKVLETHIFNCFLKERLNRKMDAFTRLEMSTRSQRMKAMLDYPRRPMMQEMAEKYSKPESRFSRKLGAGMSDTGEDGPGGLPPRQGSVRNTSQGHASLRGITTFRLPDFPDPLDFHRVQLYYCDIISYLDRAMMSVPPENSALLARYRYLRGLINTTMGKRLEALCDFQNLYKMDTDIFPGELVRMMADSLPRQERVLAERRSELQRLISRVRKDHEKDQSGRCDDTVKKFELPKKHMQLEDFVKRVQESGIMKDVETINRLFDALTVGADDAMKASSKSVFYIDSAWNGQQKQVDPEVFRVFYTVWKETEAEAQDVHLPAGVIGHLDTNECVYKLSSSVKTSHGMGKIALTQRRIFLLTEGRLGYIEITKFRDIEDVRISSAPFLLLRIPTLKIKSSQRKETFEANLKSECDLWNLMIKEMWAGRKMADDHKDPQYMQQALTNVLLMDAVVGCLQSQKAIFAASKLAYFDKMKLEVPVMVPKTTSETLKHKINPSLDLTVPQAVDVLLYTPGQLSLPDAEGGGNPKLWCALSNGKVVVFDAASWSVRHSSIQVGTSRLNCMLGVDQHQLWIGSQDSVIYIINTHSMSCNKQLTEHRSEVTDFALEEKDQRFTQTLAYSCSADGVVITWDVSTLQVRKQFKLTCDRLQSIRLAGGALWCCARDCVLELKRSGMVSRRLSLPDYLRSVPTAFSCFIHIAEKEQLWTGCTDAGELCVWHYSDLSEPAHKIQLQDCAGVNCIIKVKNQVWVGCRGRIQGKPRGKIYVVDPERQSVEKELVAHGDIVQALCSAEDRYVLSGAAREDGKVAIWKVE
uniref:DENN domain-containing protein 3 n=1 Tax=Paramormyrops kingsleyae TaxID=1676925 RepID=A0A3B3Q7N6_9TELE|nr:DENN domain-containing protein 3 isoform X1 [Paramormyrops kingsleyae]